MLAGLTATYKALERATSKTAEAVAAFVAARETMEAEEIETEKRENMQWES